MINEVNMTLILVCVAVAVVLCVPMIIFRVRKVSRNGKPDSDGPGENVSAVVPEPSDRSRQDAAGSARTIDSEVLYVVYQRVVAYFEEEKPYLNSNLTIGDVAKTLFTNRAYVSRAISAYGGTNFCQFVNSYRVRYCIDNLSSDHSLKIVDMAHLSGFNSVTSFNISFKTVMNSSAGEWLRRHRLKDL